MLKHLLLSVVILLQLNPAFADETYTVRKGDTILKIADRVLGGPGNPKRYAMAKQILAKNPEVKDGNALTPGQSIVLPDGAAAPEKAAKPAKEAPVVAAAKAVESKEKDLAPATAQAEVAAPIPAAPVAAAPIPAPAEVEKAAAAAEPVHATEAPVAHEATHPSHEGGGHANFLMIQPRLLMADFHSKEKSTGEKFELHHQMFTGLNVGYGIAMGDHSHLLIEAGITHAKVKNVMEDDFQIESKELLLKNFAIGYETGLTHSLHLHLVAQLNDYLILGPTDVADNYAPRVVQMPVAEVGLGWNFWQMSSSAIGLSAAAEYVFPGKEGGVKYKTGVEPAAGLYWASANGGDKMNYRVDLKYLPTAQKSDFVDQHGTGYGLRLGVLIPL